MRNFPLTAFMCVGLLALVACGEETPAPEAPKPAPESLAPSPAEPSSAGRCADPNPLRQAFYGDLHVHTGLSFDSYIVDVFAGPDDAYRFARGEPIALPPLDADGRPMRTLRLERPLDFAAVTDHAEFLGEVSLCTRAGSPVYASQTCARFRAEGLDAEKRGLMAERMGGFVAEVDVEARTPLRRSPELCGADGARCAGAMRSVWQEIQAAAERWNDTSDECRFTAFHAYEHTYSPEISKVHRNVVFRTARVPELPISSVEAPTAGELLERLREACLEVNGCDAIAIPHNPNLANGRMFRVDWTELPQAQQRERVQLSAQLERLVEIMQAKGDSECRNGMPGVAGAPDELCDFEKFRGLAPIEDCGEGFGSGALAGRGCVSHRDFVRYALVEGLRERARIGVNPWELGIIASTDTHNATPGDTEEASFDGIFGTRDGGAAERLSPETALGLAIPNLSLNPGGLVGVWAEENSREALFDAMKRRETFGTSGSRIAPRFFGGWSELPDLCGAPDMVARADASGVPMGSVLPPPPEGASPIFAASALRDPGSEARPGGLLQRMQIIKGWVGDDGRVRQGVYDVAGDANNGADVDPETCEPRGPGSDTLCAVWTDPDFDSTRAAVYYARVLENPSCRWNARQCLQLGSDAPPSCTDPNVPRTQQERAWTSPIWYYPRREPR